MISADGRGRISSFGRRAERDADFRRMVDEAKATWNISDVIGRRTKLKRTGRELVGICVFHQERSPSLRVNDAKGTFHCFGCGTSGDIVTFVMRTEGLAFVDAMRWLGAAELPTIDPVERARAAAEEEAERRTAIAEARAVWENSRDATGTLAELYSISRGITMTLPPSIRYGRIYSWRDKETGEIGPEYPALIGAVTNGVGDVIAVQRIFLADDGSGKRWDKPRRSKLSLGRVKGGALKLDVRMEEAFLHEVILTEGPEDGLSLAQELPGRRVWVALGTALMPFVEFPPDIRAITIAGQNDKAGKAAVAEACEALVERGFRVSTTFPDPQFKDWNDQLRGIRLGDAS